MEDRELVVLCNLGQKEQYAILVERYQRLVFSVAYHLLRSREEAEDVTQEAFVKVYARIRSTTELDFLPYIRTTVTNLSLDRLRRQRTAIKHLAATTEEDTMDYTTPESELLHTFEQRLLQQAVDLMPEMYREVLILHYVAGHSYETIATLLDQPMSIVKNRIFRGKKILKELYLSAEGGNKCEV